MRHQMAAVMLSKEEYVADVLQKFADDPLNRDRALAQCLFHLERLAMVGDALERVLPQVMTLADNPLIKRMIPSGNGR